MATTAGNQPGVAGRWWQQVRRVDSRRPRLALSMFALLGVGAVGTTAYFTDSVPVTGTQIQTARVDLQVQNLNTYTNFTALSDTLAPGSSTAGVLNVKNNGTVPLHYYLDAAATNTDAKGLAAALVVKVTGASTRTGAAPSQTCGGTTLPDSSASFSSSFVGSAASPRVLAVGATQTLCIEAALPAATPLTMQGASTNVTFNASAATSPQTTWSDTVPISGTTIAAPTITAPTLTCGASNQIQVVVNWPAVPGATGYRVFHGPDGTAFEDVPPSPNTNSYQVRNPGTGSIRVQTLYGVPEWTSGNSNTRNYTYDGTKDSTCT